MKHGFSTADWLVLIIYFVIIFSAGVFSSLKNRDTVIGYFLAGRTVNWVVVGCSLFTSNIGSAHFVGLAGTAAKTGIAVAAFEVHAVYALALLGWIFYPVYKATGVYTLPEYMQRRFRSVRLRMYVVALSLLLYMCTKISTDIYAGALFMERALPGKANMYVWMTGLVLLSAVFIITGGLTSVMWTDTLQTLVMLLGSFVLSVLALYEVGGYDKMKHKFPMALADTTILGSYNDTYRYKDCSRVKQTWFKILLPTSDPDLPWTGMVFGITVNALWYWCADQVIVHRVLAANTVIHGKMGCVMTSYLKLLPMWGIIFPGMISRILYPDEIACNEPDTCEAICNRKDGCSDSAYPLLAMRLMPDGGRGLILAVIMAGLITSLTSVLSATSTIFTFDVWKRLRKNASDLELMVIGRIVVISLVAVSILWMPVIQNAGLLYIYMQEMMSFLGAPLSAAYVMAVFWNRCTENGVFWGLVLGTVVGIVRSVWQRIIPTVICGDYEQGESQVRVPMVTDLSFLHFGPINFAFVAVVIVIISYLTPPPDTHDYMGKTFFTRHCLSEETANEAQEISMPRQFLHQLLGDTPITKQPYHVRVMLWMCGIERMAHAKEETVKHQINRGIFEEITLSYIMHANMGIAIIVITGYWVFFSV